MANIFQHVGINKPKRTKFDGGHEVKLSTNFGVLTPIMCEPVVPGDVFRCNTELFLRFAPLNAPIMHRVNVFTHFFFVPSRLVWDEFKTFITGGEDGTEQPVYPRYNFPDTPVAVGSLLDYLGFPIGMKNGIDALPLRAYQLIYNEYYRDQNLEEPVDFSLTSGIVDINDDDDEYAVQALRYRCFEKDYFTSALPFAQRGPSAVIPFAGQTDITIEDGLLTTSSSSSSPYYQLLSIDSGSPAGDRKVGLMDVSENSIDGDDGYLRNDVSGYFGQRFSLKEAVASFPNGVNATTINDLRKAIQLQKWLERNARGGARYIEQILSHFGVQSSDARLQRPEYLGGGMSPVSIQGVVQNSASEGENGTPQGNLSGMATAIGNTHAFTKYFEEHGYVIGIMSIMPRSSYQQGLPRKYQKFDKFDYYWPEFAHLGEQEVKNSELYYTGTEQDEETFGYQSRYAEYKAIPSTVHGDFRDTLKFWHAGRIFGNRPQLNADFVHLNPASLDRIWAVGDNLSDQKIYVELYNNLQMIRPMPFIGEPGWMDHF